MPTLELQKPVTSNASYFDIPALSNSGMKDLAVSPLRYWHKHINPEREPESSSAAMLFGSALHCAVLEPGEFDGRYACEVVAEDYPDYLVTCEDIRRFLKEANIKASGTRKDDLIEAAKKALPNAPIFDDLKDAAEFGKIVIKRDDWQRLTSAVETLRREPRVNQILSKGMAEVALFAEDPDTGVPLKGKLDWLSIDGPKATIFDLKTFSNSRGKSMEMAIADAIYYEAYYRQAYLYHTLLSLQPDPPKQIEVVFGFVESEAPFETRLKAMRPKTGGQPNLYWLRAQLETREAARKYADCQKRFGDRPWRSAREIEPLMDDDIRQLAYDDIRQSNY